MDKLNFKGSLIAIVYFTFVIIMYNIGIIPNDKIVYNILILLPFFTLILLIVPFLIGVQTVDMKNKKLENIPINIF